MARDKEGRDTICISLLDVPEGEGGASEARWDLTAFGDTSMEMAQHLHGLCDPSATDL